MGSLRPLEINHLHKTKLFIYLVNFTLKSDVVHMSTAQCNNGSRGP